MNPQETLKELNKRIDKLIIQGKADSKEYKRLCKMHLAIIKEMGLIK